MKKAAQIIVLLSFTFLQNNFSQNLNYKIGDTLHVYTLSGLKLRDSCSVNSKALVTMKLGASVEVVDTLKSKQIIDGFSGNWVKIKYDTFVGFAFDGFLSSLPIPCDALRLAFIEKAKTEENVPGYRGQEMDECLAQYIHQEFKPICEPVEYFNGYGGEGYHSLLIQKLSRGFTEISHQGWEGGGTELLLPDVRLAEVKNLIILLAYQCNVDAELLEMVKKGVKQVSDEKIPLQEILSLDMFWIKIKSYPSENNQPKWSIEFDCAAD